MTLYPRANGTSPNTFLQNLIAVTLGPMFLTVVVVVIFVFEPGRRVK